MPSFNKATKQKIPHANHSLLVISGNDLQREVQNSKCLLALLVKELTRCLTTTSLPTAILELIQEFQDLAPKEFPSELPHMRTIQHNIDLQLGVTFPNLPHY